MATNYLIEKGAGELYNKLENSEAVFTIMEFEAPAYNVPNQTVKWNPLFGILTNEGVTLSPATALNHEFDHAAQATENPEQSAIDRDPKDGPENPYRTKEEERVITGSEQKTAKALGEIKEGQVTRKDHGGTPFIMFSPISVEIDWSKPQPQGRSN